MRKKTLQCTNKNCSLLPNDKENAPIAMHELIKTFGYVVATASRNFKNRCDLFRNINEKLFPSLYFGRRFGISRNRFEMVIRNLSFNDSKEITDDKWSPIREYLDDLNSLREKGFHPCWKIVVDKSILSWRVLDGKKSKEGMLSASSFICLL